MKIIVSLFLILTGKILFAQDSLIVKEQIKGGIPYFCNNTSWHHAYETYSKSDSLTKCFYILTFSTNNSKILYDKKFNLNKEIVAEGPVIMVKNKKIIFRKVTYSAHEHGLWKFYNYETQQITFKNFRCLCSKNVVDDFSELLFIKNINDK